MITISTHILKIVGPATVFILIYMTHYLWAQKAITFWQLMFYPFWPQLVFRYRDLTKKKNGRISRIYYLFFGCLITLILSIVAVTITEMKYMPIPAMVFVGLAIFLFIPIVIYIFILLSKETYY